MSPLRKCDCGFDNYSVSPLMGPEWYRAHRDRHLRAFPDLDQVTRDNFEILIEWAERRECAS